MEALGEGGYSHDIIFCSGEVPEWLNGTVSKTVMAFLAIVGSNPTLSARTDKSFYPFSLPSGISHHFSATIQCSCGGICFYPWRHRRLSTRPADYFHSHPRDRRIVFFSVETGPYHFRKRNSAFAGPCGHFLDLRFLFFPGASLTQGFHCLAPEGSSDASNSPDANIQEILFFGGAAFSRMGMDWQAETSPDQIEALYGMPHNPSAGRPAAIRHKNKGPVTSCDRSFSDVRYIKNPVCRRPAPDDHID
jgi:hypothetical protein